MNKNLFYLLLISILVITSFFAVSPLVFAENVLPPGGPDNPGGPGGPGNNPKVFEMGSFFKAATKDQSPTDTMKNRVAILGPAFFGVFYVIGNVLAVLVLAVYGLKWMLATPQKKAELKEGAWAYIIGCGVIFAAGNITYVVWNLMENISK